jgi:exonuclease VII large subunit
MDKMNRKFSLILLIVVIGGFDLYAIYMGSKITGISKGGPLTVSELFESALLGEDVIVEGRISEVLPDHISRKGFRYQQFYVSDGKEKIKFFCSIKYGRTNVKEGNQVLVEGEFKKYYKELEIYGWCSEVKILGD